MKQKIVKALQRPLVMLKAQRTPVHGPGLKASTTTMQMKDIKRGVAISSFFGPEDTPKNHGTNLARLPSTSTQKTVMVEGAIQSVVARK